MKRKWISVLLTLVMLVTLTPAITLTASADTLTTVVANRANEVIYFHSLDERTAMLVNQT